MDIFGILGIAGCLFLLCRLAQWHAGQKLDKLERFYGHFDVSGKKRPTV